MIDGLTIKIGKIEQSADNGTVFLETVPSKISELSAKLRQIKGKTGRRVFIGIDPGIAPLTMAFLCVDEDCHQETWTINILAKKKSEGNDWRDRYLRVTSISECVGLILKTLKARKPYICIEGYAYQSGKGAAYTLAEIKQAVLEKIEVNTKGFRNVLLLPPPTWKACLCPKKGGANKEDVKVCLLRYSPEIEVFGKDHNKYDAYAMAYAYQQIKAGKLATKSAESLIDREKIEIDTKLYNLLT